MCKFFEIISYIYFQTRCLKKSQKQNFELYQVFMCWIVLNTLGQNVSKDETNIFKMYQAFLFWTGVNILSQNVSKIRHENVWTISSRYMLNCFKYFWIYFGFWWYNLKNGPTQTSGLSSTTDVVWLSSLFFHYYTTCTFLLLLFLLIVCNRHQILKIRRRSLCYFYFSLINHAFNNDFSKFK